MPAIITNQLRIKAADFFQENIKQVPAYIFIGGTSPWPEESEPPAINDSTLDRIFAFEEFVGMKRIQTADIISVLPRRDWIPGKVYDQYTDAYNLIDGENPETNDFFEFYVVTDEFNVYKCISNNNRATSEIKPSGTTINTFQTPDGYVWKFMYTIRSADAFRYMTPNWVPCYTLYSNDGSSQWLVQSSATPGTIDNIVLDDFGANYSSANPPNVEITGNGAGASAIAQVDDETGTISNIIITDSGSGYTDASVAITNNGGNGVGAQATPILSPLKGHGHDARSELGATYQMIRVVFEGDESGVLPIGTEYRKAGILINPLSKESGTTLVVVKTDLYQVGETITGQASLASGNIRSIDHVRGYIHVDNVVGVFSQNELVSSQPYNETVVLQVNESSSMPLTEAVVGLEDYTLRSGELMYFSTREKITRGANQTEELRFVISH